MRIRTSKCIAKVLLLSAVLGIATLFHANAQIAIYTQDFEGFSNTAAIASIGNTGSYIGKASANNGWICTEIIIQYSDYSGYCNGVLTGEGTDQCCDYTGMGNYATCLRHQFLVSSMAGAISGKSLGLGSFDANTLMDDGGNIWTYFVDMSLPTDRFVKTSSAINMASYLNTLFDVKLDFDWYGEGDGATGHDYGMVQFLNPSTNAVYYSFTSSATGSTKFSNQTTVQHESLSVPSDNNSVALAFRYVCDIDNNGGNSSFVVDNVALRAYPKIKPTALATSTTVDAGATTTITRDDLYSAYTTQGLSYEWYKSTDGTNYTKVAGSGVTLTTDPITTTTYYICKIVCGTVVLESDPVVIAANADPDCATVVSPKNNATNVFPNEDLYWNTAANATSYDVYFGETAGGMTKLGNTTNTHYEIPQLTEGQTYYWKIVPKNGDRTPTSECDTWSFTARRFNDCTIDFFVEDFENITTGLVPSEAESVAGWYCNTNTKMQWWEGHQTSGGVVVKPYRCYANLWSIGQDNTYGIAGKGLGLITTRYLEYGDLDNTKFGTDPFVGYFQYVRSWVNGTTIPTKMYRKLNTQGLRDIKVSFDLNMSGNADNYLYLSFTSDYGQSLLPNNDTYTKYNNVNQTYVVNYPAEANNAASFVPLFGLMHTSGDSTIYHVALDNIVFSACPYEGVIGSTKKDAGQDYEWTAGNNETTTLRVDGTYEAMAEFQWERSTDNATWSDIAGANAIEYTPDANPAQTYYYRCKVSYKADAGCCPGVYQANSFKIISLTVDCTTPVTPQNGATNVFPNEDLYWAAVANATSYDVYFGTTADGMTLVGNTANAYYEISKLTEGQTYYWKVVPKIGDRTPSTECDTWSFTARRFNDCTIDFFVEDFDNKNKGVLTETPIPNTWYFISPFAPNTYDYVHTITTWEQDAITGEPVPGTETTQSWYFRSMMEINQYFKTGLYGKGLGFTTYRGTSATTIPTAVDTMIFKARNVNVGGATTPYVYTATYGSPISFQYLRDLKFSCDYKVQGNATNHAVMLHYNNSAGQARIGEVIRNASGTMNVDLPVELNNTTDFSLSMSVVDITGAEEAAYTSVVDNIVISGCPVAGVIASDQTDAGEQFVWTAPYTQTATLQVTETHPMAEFQWESSTDGTTYAPIAGANGRTYVTPAGLNQTTWFRCKVSYKADAGCCPGVYQDNAFKIIPQPDCADILKPTDGEEQVRLDVTLQWNPVPGATEYDVYFGETSGALTKAASDINTTSYKPTVDLVNSKTYYWQVIPKINGVEATGCAEWSFKTVTEYKEPWFPNAIALNSKNDANRVFRACDKDNHANYLTNYKKQELTIFNRWGKKVFSESCSENEPKKCEWNTDGSDKDIKSGTYFWVCTITDYYGTEHQYNGTITVLE